MNIEHHNQSIILIDNFHDIILQDLLFIILQYRITINDMNIKHHNE